MATKKAKSKVKIEKQEVQESKPMNKQLALIILSNIENNLVSKAKAVIDNGGRIEESTKLINAVRNVIEYVKEISSKGELLTKQIKEAQEMVEEIDGLFSIK